MVQHIVRAAICTATALVAGVACSGDAASEQNGGGAAVVTSDSAALRERTNRPADAPIGALAISGADVDSAMAANRACPRDGRWHVCSVQSRFSLAGLRVLALDSVLGIPGIDVETKGWRIGSQQLRLAFFASEAEARHAMDQMDSARAVPIGSAESPWMERPTLLHNANVVGVLLGGTDRAIERASNALMAGPPQPSP